MGMATAPADLVSARTRIRQTKREMLRREVVDGTRIDLLATQLLGYELRPFHRELLDFQSTITLLLCRPILMSAWLQLSEKC